jgi:hypothetical protein
MAGRKNVVYDAETWDDHDVDCHGDYMDFEDDSDYAEGFSWSCCDRPGNDEGCKITKHKAKVNIIVQAAVPPLASKKRKATGELARTKELKCALCGKRYDPRAADGEHCFFHTGILCSFTGMSTRANGSRY